MQEIEEIRFRDSDTAQLADSGLEKVEKGHPKEFKWVSYKLMCVLALF